MKTFYNNIVTGLIFCFIGSNLDVCANILKNPKDSIGAKIINGKNFTLHKVVKNESLYKIAKRYKTTVAQIQTNNPKIVKGLKENQILEILRISVVSIAQADKSKIKIHVVGSGQTLFAISQLYKVSIEEITTWNNLQSELLKEGQQLQVSPKISITTTQLPKKTTKPDLDLVVVNEKNQPTHLVEPSQTLFSIAKKYRVSVDKIKTWNGLISDELLAGQLLIVSAEGFKDAQNTTLTNISAPVIVPETPNSTIDNPVPTTQIPRQTTTNSGLTEKKIALPISTTTEPASSAVQISSENGYERIVETGLAELIEQSNDSRKYLCLHRSAPIGAVLQVKNESNGNLIFIRVIGRLPNTGPNERIILRISKKAYERLNPASKRFVVEVSYPKS